MTEEQKQELGRKIKKGQWDKPQEEIYTWLKKRSDKRKAEMKRVRTTG